jgi:K+-transporting ATPase KdpF subunit
LPSLPDAAGFKTTSNANREAPMLVVTGVVTLLLFVYLLAALLRPEWF